MLSVEQLSGALLASKRLEGDEPADTFIASCFNSAEAKRALQEWLTTLNQNSALGNTPPDYAAVKFITYADQLPVWADQQMMKAGSAFFVKYADQIMQLLGLLSLPYCYAAADGAMVLYLSQRLKNNTEERLLDTADFIWQVMAPNAFEKEGKGFASILKIRLAHAAARYYTLKSGKWNMSLGFPINQEDQAGTNLAFSLMVIRGLRKLGVSISYSEQQSFLHLWNVIGYLLGMHEELIAPDGKTANALELAIRQRHFKPSEPGRSLAKTLCDYLTTAVPADISGKDILQLMRYLLGNEVADLLNIPDHTIPAYVPHILKITGNLPNISTYNTQTQEAYLKKYREFKTRIKGQQAL